MSNLNFGVNFENLVYVYLNKNPHIYAQVDDDFFKNQTIRALFKLSKKFYETFKEPIFDPKHPNIGQIEALVLEDKSEFLLDKNLSDDENVNAFLKNVQYVIETDLNNYSEDWLDETIGAWITWQNNQKGYKLAIQYMQTQSITPSNVVEVISKAKDIVVRRSNVQINDEDVFDFFDPKSHKQIPLDNLIDSGYPGLNQMLCGNPTGGFAPGTLTIFAGASNSGKSVILGNLAKNISFSGKNTLFVSVEMSIQRSYRRIGSNAFDVKMSDYDAFADNQEQLTDEMRHLQENIQKNIGVPPGKFIGIKFSKATPNKIYAVAKKLEERYGIKWHAIIIDYFTELDSDYGISPEKMYIYHKRNADDLFQIASETGWAVITAHQLKIAGFDKGDLTLADLGESSGIIHRTDSIIGMISSSQMQIEKCMYFKNLKCRESAYKNYYLKMDTDFSHMRITESSSLLSPEEFGVF